MEEMKKSAGCCNMPDGHNKNTTCGDHTTGGAEKSRDLWDIADELDQIIRNKADQLESTALAVCIAMECGACGGDAYTGVVRLMLDNLHVIAKCAERLSDEILIHHAKEATPC